MSFSSRFLWFQTPGVGGCTPKAEMSLPPAGDGVPAAEPEPAGSSPRETDAILKQSPTPVAPEDPWEGAESSVLKLKGLPYSASEQAIREFFAGYSVSFRLYLDGVLVPRAAAAGPGRCSKEGHRSITGALSVTRPRQTESPRPGSIDPHTATTSPTDQGGGVRVRARWPSERLGAHMAAPRMMMICHALPRGRVPHAPSLPERLPPIDRPPRIAHRTLLTCTQAFAEFATRDQALQVRTAGSCLSQF